MTTPKKKTILDYFSQANSSQSDDIAAKKQKMNRKLIESSLESSLDDGLIISSQNQENILSLNSIENLNNSTYKSTTPESDIMSNDETPLNTPNHSKRPTINKIIADYLDTQPTDFLESSQIDLNSERQESSCPHQEERYEFLIDVRDKNKIRKGEEGYDPKTLYIPSKYYQKFTPFEKQFWDIKSENFDTVIFFKKGKFYELYEDDAEIASKLFDLKITERVNMKMAGVPESSYEIWASKFISHGFRIGRVDQTENAIGKKIREQNGKKDKIITRELKEIVTCGTAYNSEFFDSCFPFYLCVLIQHSFCTQKECNGPLHFSILLYDASINKIFTKTFCDSYDCNQLRTMFAQNDIRELITNEKIKIKKEVKIHLPINTPVASSRKYDFSNDHEYQCFVYLFNFMKSLNRESALENAVITDIKDSSEFMSLDATTLINLDILTNNFDFSEDNSLYKAVNHCHTPMGRRLMKNWIVSPLRDVDKIFQRRQIVEVFSANDISKIVGLFKELGDIERYYGKLETSNPSFKDLYTLFSGIKKAKTLLEHLEILFKNNLESAQKLVISHKNALIETLDDFGKVYCVSETEIVPGNENDELFRLNNEQAQIQHSLEDFLNNLRKMTGFADLCFRSIGKEPFQIETSISNQMPAGFYVVSTTKTHRRYYSQKLREIIVLFEECEEKIFQSKGSILRRAVDFLKKYSLCINQAVNYLASIDCLISFSIFNRSFASSVAVFGDNLEIINFTNPIYPDYIKNVFSPKNKITVVTGPNMGGKSTFLRSICLNIILAQMGMNVLCEHMVLPVFDQIFTRIGASDSLARGESTFMVEMNEASKILNYSTSKSFVIMDELGRGTSTKDGEAIARSVLDYLKIIDCYCLFSTHYHNLVRTYSGVDKAYVDCKINSDDIVFLYKIKDGICNDSHGIYVAKLAGIPESIVEDAFEIKKQIYKE